MMGIPFRRRAPRREQVCARIDLGGAPLDYLLKRSSARRTLALRVSERGEVVVNAPISMARSGVEAFIRRHADWIAQRRAQLPPRSEWRDGMPLPYLGQEIRLCWQALPSGEVRLENGQLWVGGVWETVPARVLDWYRAQAKCFLGERLAWHAARMQVPRPPLRLSNARTRWGSLSPKGVVSLNWRLMKMPVEILDYVICHELAHLRQRNHSAAFWREVAALYPDYAEARAGLRRLGPRSFDF
jgi:hypothetical protein